MGVSTVTIEEGTMNLVWVKEDIEAAVMAAKEAGMGDDMMWRPTRSRVTATG